MAVRGGILTNHKVSWSSALPSHACLRSNTIIIFNSVVGFQLLTLISVLSAKCESFHLCLSTNTARKCLTTLATSKFGVFCRAPPFTSFCYRDGNRSIKSTVMEQTPCSQVQFEMWCKIILKKWTNWLHAVQWCVTYLVFANEKSGWVSLNL